MIYLLLLFTAICSTAYTQTPIETTTVEETTVLSTTSTTPNPLVYLTDSASTYSWSPKSDDYLIIEADEGYKITVNITDCNIDGENGEYATISTEEYGDGLTFTYMVSNESAYLYNTNRLVGQFVGTNASNFTALFTIIGEPLTSTTTELPTTSIYLPTPGDNDSSTLVVYISGRDASDYRSTKSDALDILIGAIAGMAAEYCENENFPLNGSIVTDNVVINQLVQCSINWPDSNMCVVVNFSVPVNLRDDIFSLWSGYQMTTKHLEIMWARYASTFLTGGMTVYYPPDASLLNWGIVISCGVTVIFVLCLLAVRYIGIKVSKMMSRRRLSDTTSIISTSDRNSQISLPPHYLQETPALFENAYPMYNPDKSPTYTEYTKSFDYSDYQDDLVTDLKEPDEDDLEESGA